MRSQNYHADGSRNVTEASTTRQLGKLDCCILQLTGDARGSVKGFESRSQIMPSNVTSVKGTVQCNNRVLICSSGEGG